MLYSLQKWPNNVQLGIWKVEETLASLQTEFSALTLSDSLYRKFTNKNRKLEWLAVRRLLKELCGAEKQVLYTESGRPYLADDSYKLSISHTKGFVAVLLHSVSEVGMDIERRGDRALYLSKRFLHPDEIVSLQRGNEALQATICWSAKESLFKVLDVSGVDFIHHLHIQPFEVNEAGAFTAYETKTALLQKFELQYKVFPDFVLTWCSR